MGADCPSWSLVWFIILSWIGLPVKGAEHKERFRTLSPCGEGRPDNNEIALFTNISIRPPRVGRDISVAGENFLNHISIHPPCVGRDLAAGVVGYGESISVHPPCEGRDCTSPTRTPPTCYFNPPSPCGEGQQKYTKILFYFMHFRQNSLAFFVTTSCFLGENQKTGDEFVKISVRRSQGNPGRFPLAPV